VLGAALATVSTWALASPASANSMAGCVYPRVCFYLTDDQYFGNAPTAAFQDVTSGYQTLGPRSRGARWIVNTRNDDTAHLHFTDGSTWCMTPGEVDLWTSKTVDKIRISSSATC
jgi:hypothetical protein